MITSLSEIEVALSNVPLFSRLPPRSLKRLARVCVPKQYGPDAVIVKEGTNGSGMFLLLSGRVRVTKNADDREIVLADLGPGEVLGEIAVVDEQPRSATAVALEPTTCLLLTRANFHSLVEAHPQVAWPIVPSLAERLRHLQERLIDAEEQLLEAESRQRAAADAVPSATDTSADTPAVADALAQSATPPAGRRHGGVTYDSAEPQADVGLGTKLARAQLGLFLSGTVGVSESAFIMETFLRSLAAETKLADDRKPVEMFQDLPSGVLRASWKTLNEGRKMPRRMLASFLDPLGQRADR
ncbi:MAG: cyclic nucleotide-binding domain-containing protein [Acidobacteriota bacterium]